MNKIKSFKSHALVRHCLLVMVGMLCALPSWAYEVVVKDIKYEVNKQERTAVVVDFDDGLSSTTEIQEYVSGYLVSGIESYAFRNCYRLESITIPASAFNIGDHAFMNCYRLKSIKMTDSNYSQDYHYSIGDNAFDGCSSLSSINIPSSVTSIGDYAFYDCDYLTSINIPSSVTSIGGGAFKGCSSLTAITVDESNPIYGSDNNVLFRKKDNCLILARGDLEKYDIPSWVTSIGNTAFAGCRSLTSINIPSSVTSIEGSAFDGCSSLSSINIPSSVTSIGDRAFNECRSLTSINIPSSVTRIGDGAFNECSSLTTITVDESNPMYSSENNVFFSKKEKSLIRAGVGLEKYDIPSSVTSIRSSAFYNCSSLTSISIPSSVTSIGEKAFSYCRSLTSINIPSSVTRIEWLAFYKCSNLKAVRFKGKVPPTFNSDIFRNTSDLKVYVPHGTLEAYKNALGDNVNNVGIIEENQSTLYPQALELFTPDYTSLIPSNANAKQVAAVQNKADYTANDGLIVDASQLSSNAVEPTEGSLAALIDNDRSTFFQSTWSETNTTGDWHYLQVDLRASYKQMVLKYTKRQGFNGNTPVKLHVYATNTPDAAGGWEDLGTQTCTYDYESGQTGILPLSLGNGYRHVRLTVEETADNKKINGNLYFYWSELHAYHRPCKADVLDEAKRSALTTAMAQAKKEMDAGQETSKTTYALQDALTDAENFISLNERKAVDFAKSFYLTAYSDKPMTVPTGMQAAIVLADNNGGIRTDYCYNAGDVIPAHTGVLLKSGKGNAFHLPIAATAEDAPEGNLLHGTLTDEITYAEGCDRYYKLSYDFETRSVIGFYWAEDNAAPFLNKAGKAFLALPSDAKVAICGVSLNELAEGATTAIRPATDAPTAPFRAYTLDGRRVNAASQGELKKGFYIINGRKVMVK